MIHTKSMYITNVEKEGPFLKIWGQTDKKAALEVEEALLRASEHFEARKYLLKPNALEIGLMCCAKYIDEKYYRARITSVAPLSDGMVEVNFLDYGNKNIVPAANLRSLECFNSSFISLPPLSSQFILAEVVCIGGEWNDHIVEQIAKEIRYIEANYVVVAHAIKYYFIKVYVGDIDLGLHLVRQSLMQNTSIQTQEAVLLAMIPRAPQPSPPNQSLLQYKSFTLEPNNPYQVYVSYITEGPCHFSVQLKKYETALTQLMTEINAIPLKPLEELPIPGTVCLAKCLEDGQICRAVVTSEVDSQYKLFYVDFGNTELVPPENLFQMAFKFIIPKIMAIRLSVAGIEKTSMTLEMLCAFKKFVDNRLLMMEVLPGAKKLALPKCKMWDPDTNTDVIEILNRAAKCAYPDPIALHKGFTQLVKVSFVYSCNRFYVQLKSKEPDLNQLMVNLQTFCNSNHTSYLDGAKVGQPCCALFSFDQQWYRSLITEVKGNTAKVRYIDYGNEEDVAIETLKVVEGEYLTVLRPQAIECCLNGYQNMNEDEERDNKLEELILEQEFTMRVIDTITNKTLVDLMDDSNTTVSALLLEAIIAQSKKLSAAPVVEQQKFESREKRFSPDDDRRGDIQNKPYYQHDDRRPPRVNSRDTNDDKTSWRQSARKRSDSNSNESVESWRQDNRGFKNRKENDWNERSPNDNSRNERGGFRGRKDNFKDDERPYKPRNEGREQGGKEDSWSKPPRRNDDFGDSNARGGGWKDKQDNQEFKKRNEEWGGAKDDNRSQNKYSRNAKEDCRSSNAKTDNWNDNQGSKPIRFQQNDEWGAGGKEDNYNQNKYSRKGNEEYGSNKNSWNQNKSRDTKAEWGAGNSKDDNRSNDKERWGNNDRKKDFGNRNQSENDDWSNKNSGGGGDRNENKGYKGRNNDNRGGGESWNANKGSERKFGDRNRDNNREGGFKKPFRREGSEISSSGSEKSFGKGLRTSSRNDNRPPRPDRKFGNKSNDNSWNVSSVPSVIDSAPNDATFKEIDVNGRQEKVTISWFHNPCSFFCQLVESQETFRNLMQEIQDAYKGRPAGTCVKGAPAVGLFPEDNVLYRARIMEVLGSQYKIHYVDFGNVSVVDKVWPIENKFMNLPMQAIPCGLTGIQPIGEDWPNPDNFSKYFEKEHLDCNFGTSENGRYWVSLNSENEDLSQQLIDASLAKYCETAVINFEIGLLVGQQFRAMVQTVNGPSDFTLLLQSGISFNCAIHNLSSATEINEDVLKQQLAQLVIAYADDLVEDRLEVTLYDLTGSKLNTINPDEGAFDTVEALCPYLVVTSTIQGYVSHVNETSIAIQPTECSSNIEYVLQQMYEYYENMPPDNPLIPEEEFLYATKSEDGNWYRARVKSFDDDKATVVYLDYGNSEEVPFSNLRELIAEFMQFDAMAVLVNVKVPTSDLLEHEVTATIYYGEEGWEGEVQIAEGLVQPAAVEELPPVLESANEPSEKSAETSQDASEIPLPPSTESSELAGTIEEAASSGIETDNSAGRPVVLSHIDSPSDFYIQLVDSLGAIDELQLKLQEKVEELTLLENASVGGLCAAPYSVDQQWYRSQILDADDDITTVRFIDYGNTDVIDNKTTQIKTLPAELLSLEEYATRCRLKINPTEEEWPVAATERFEILTAAENVRVEFIDQDEKTNYVELHSNGDNVKDILIQEGLAVLDDVQLEGKLTGFISHMNSPSEFWVQLESCCAELEWIAEQLSNAASFTDLEDLTPGSLCAAMFPDDEMWYRARILSNTVAGLEVLFLDYGNSCICSSLKQLPEHLIMASPLAQKCSLQKPSGLLNWSAEASTKFNELSAEGQTIFTVKKLTTGETSIVELLVDGEDVSSKLLPVTDNGYVTDIDSIESFSISKDGITSEEKFKLEKVPGVEFTQDSVDKFVEISNEGKTCFNVEFLPDNTVRLYLNGNDIRTDLLSLSPQEKVIQPLEGELPKPESCPSTSTIDLQDEEQNDTLENTTQMVDSLVTNIINDAYSTALLNKDVTAELNEMEELNANKKNNISEDSVEQDLQIGKKQPDHFENDSFPTKNQENTELDQVEKEMINVQEHSEEEGLKTNQEISLAKMTEDSELQNLEHTLDASTESTHLENSEEQLGKPKAGILEQKLTSNESTNLENSGDAEIESTQIVNSKEAEHVEESKVGNIEQKLDSSNESTHLETSGKAVSAESTQIVSSKESEGESVEPKVENLEQKLVRSSGEAETQSKLDSSTKSNQIETRSEPEVKHLEHLKEPENLERKDTSMESSHSEEAETANKLDSSAESTQLENSTEAENLERKLTSPESTDSENSGELKTESTLDTSAECLQLEMHEILEEHKIERCVESLPSEELNEPKREVKLDTSIESARLKNSEKIAAENLEKPVEIKTTGPSSVSDLKKLEKSSESQLESSEVECLEKSVEIKSTQIELDACDESCKSDNLGELEQANLEVSAETTVIQSVLGCEHKEKDSDTSTESFKSLNSEQPSVNSQEDENVNEPVNSEDCEPCDTTRESCTTPKSKDDKDKIEFHDEILVSFPAPTISESVKVTTRLSPTKSSATLPQEKQDD